jgi:hypothetical protein
MKHLKLYEQFRLILESSNWKEKIEINGKEYKIKWGKPAFELAEIFQTLNHHKSNLPKEWQESFGVIFQSEMPKIFNEQREPSEEYINKELDSSMKGQKNDVVTNYSSYELLQLEKLDEITGEKLKPYHNFIKEIHKAFWGGKRILITEENIKELAKNKASEPGDSDTGFHKVIEDEKYIDKYKVYYDIYVKKEDNPNGILDAEQVGKEKCVVKIKMGLPNMKEPTDPEHKKIWNKYRVSEQDLEKNPDAYQKFASEIYFNINTYDGYFGKSFKFFEDSIVSGKEVPLSAAVKLNGQLFLTGGNRRMTFYCGKKILPTIWVWNI